MTSSVASASRPQTTAEAFHLLVIAGVLAMGAFVFWQIAGWPQRADIPRVSATELREALQEPGTVLLVDARPRVEYEAEHIPNALLLNEDEWAELLPAVLEAWQPGQVIVIYCSDRGCRASESVAKRLQEVGLEDMLVLDGGWEAWKEKR